MSLARRLSLYIRRQRVRESHRRNLEERVPALFRKCADKEGGVERPKIFDPFAKAHVVNGKAKLADQVNQALRDVRLW